MSKSRRHGNSRIINLSRAKSIPSTEWAKKELREDALLRFLFKGHSRAFKGEVAVAGTWSIALWASRTSCSTSVSARFNGSNRCSLHQYRVQNAISLEVWRLDNWKEKQIGEPKEIPLTNRCMACLWLKKYVRSWNNRIQTRGNGVVPAHVDILGKLLQHSLHNHLQPCKHHTSAFLHNFSSWFK